ncbi:MAG: flagellar motor switch protein FliM [Methylobacter sp.]
MSDLLLQEEIDALLKGVDDGDFEIEIDEFQDQGSAKNYDFSSQERIVRRRIPTLEMINERFSKYLRNSLFKFLHRSPEIFISDIQIQKFSEYIRGLCVPTNLNIIRFSPLRGRALIVIQPNLIFTAVDNFFGGGGQLSNTAEAREFTLTEMRVIQILIDMIFNDLKQAWEPVMELNFEYMSSEINPHFANIVGAEDIVVISTVNIALEGGGGDINIVMPYSMIEPIRALLDTIGDDSDETDIQWKLALRNEILEAEVSVNSPMVEKTLSIREVLHLKKGDVIPVDMPKTVLLKVEGVPVFTGKACASEGYYAVQIIDKVRAGSI